MTNVRCSTLVLLLLLSSYALCDGSKLDMKKVDSPKNQDMEQYTPEHQISRATTIAEAVLKDAARQKRSQTSDFSSSEFKDFNDILYDLEDNMVTSSMPSNAVLEMVSQLVQDTLRQINRCKDPIKYMPRLGRSIDFRHLDSTFGLGSDVNGGRSDGNSMAMRQQKPFMSRLSKKSVPFKPRLGKRTQQSMLCD